MYYLGIIYTFKWAVSWMIKMNAVTAETLITIQKGNLNLRVFLFRASRRKNMSELKILFLTKTRI